MNESPETTAALAKDAYLDRSANVGGKPITIAGHQYAVIAYADTPSGFHATANRPVGTDAIVIAYRGTKGIQDTLVDTVMVADKLNPQDSAARRITKEVLKYATQNQIATDHWGNGQVGF